MSGKVQASTHLQKCRIGKLGISEFGVSVIGFIILMAVGWLSSQDPGSDEDVRGDERLHRDASQPFLFACPAKPAGEV